MHCKRIGLQPAATVYVQSVVEEESTGNGALMTHLRGYRADAVLIPEPEEEKLVRANTGVLWFQVEVRGMPVHVREMGAGANAIDAAYRVIGELRKLEAEWNADKAGREHFENEEHPINLNIGKIDGGDWASSVPGWCRLDCRIAIYPGVMRPRMRRGRSASAVAAFARADRVPRQQSAAGDLQRLLSPRATCSSPARRPKPCSPGASRRDRQGRSKAS